MFDRQYKTNGGVSHFALESQAYNSASTSTGCKPATRRSSTPMSSMRRASNTPATAATRARTAPTPPSSWQGAFTGGGNSMGIYRDNQDATEIAEHHHDHQGSHAINFGGRLRFTERRQLLELRLQRPVHPTNRLQPPTPRILPPSTPSPPAIRCRARQLL